MSNEITVAYEGTMHAEARMTSPDRHMNVDAPATCGGSGESFSPKDVFAAAYGSCVIMSMDIVARKAGFDIAGAKINVSITMVKGGAPHIGAVDATVVLPRDLAEGQLDLLRKGADYCPIHHVVRPDVNQTLTFEVGA